MTKYFKPEGIVVGPVETVGYRHFPATEEFPPCRIYYPAILQPKGKIKSIGWFHDQVTFFLRANWIAIPEVSLNAEVDDRKKYPVIVFSHGLTGTGQENSILCSAWAKKGFVVVSVHHMDGSSGCVKLPDGSKLYYDKGPPLTNYDRNYRPKQVLQRANEMKQAYNLLKSTAISEDLKSICDLEKSVAAGFSFGAATTAMVSTLEDHPFKALIFLDGWFHIDIMHSAGIEFKFPAQAFEAGIKLPSLFINSEEFESYTKIWNATVELAGHSSRIHVLQDTTHQNFTDVVFWLPKWLLSKMQIMVGGADGREVHAEIVRKTSDFLEEQFSR